jgi:AhpD family alkylhydroperoxidase
VGTELVSGDQLNDRGKIAGLGPAKDDRGRGQFKSFQNLHLASPPWPPDIPGSCVVVLPGTNTPYSGPRAQALTRKNGKEMTMDARIDYLGSPLALKVVKHINSAGAALHDSALPAATQELVKLRASQINGCGFCTDMHIKDALHAGETQQRLNLVAVWREAKVFTEAERAALELAEQGTRIADAAGGVTDEVWANAAKHYDDDQLVALVTVIALINTYNRMNVIIQQPAGDYQPGQFG